MRRKNEKQNLRKKKKIEKKKNLMKKAKLVEEEINLKKFVLRRLKRKKLLEKKNNLEKKKIFRGNIYHWYTKVRLNTLLNSAHADGGP